MSKEDAKAREKVIKLERAKRFGIETKDTIAEKKESRAERFGLNKEAKNRMRRAERFGMMTEELLKEKKQKRAARFS